MIDLTHITLLVYLATLGRFEVQVRPQTIFAGANVRVTCKVPRHVDNRWVEWGIDNFEGSGRQLDGIHAPVTYESFIERVPCELDSVYCSVTDSLGKTRTTTRKLTILGCDPDDGQ